METELNEQESSYSKYKSAVQKLEETCKNKITKINAKERSSNRFVFGRAKPADLDRTFASPTWPNQGWSYSTNRNNITRDLGDFYLSKKRSQSINKTVLLDKPRRIASNARQVDRMPKEMRDKIEENRRALRERVELINFMQK